MADILRYSPIAVQDPDTFLQIADSVHEEEGLICKKCDFMKPLRTHHCSVCDQCVIMMDHHCMWTNNCIGLHNYKQFLQLCGFAEVASFYTVFLIWCLEDEQFYATSKLSMFYTFAKFWDLLIGKGMMAFWGWNMYVASTGMTYLEYKNAMELTYERSRQMHEIPKDNEAPKKQVRKLMKFNYAFSSWLENLVRVFRSANPVNIFLFSDWGEDPELCFNGTEWTSFYYFGVI
jgi:hypothetical protein